MNETANHAAVVGAGMSGLAIATLLANRGWHVDVYERWPEVKAVGTGIGLWPAAMGVLDQVGVGDTLRTIGVAQSDGALRDSRGRVLLRLRSETLEKRVGGPVLLVSRQRILQALEQAARDSGAMLHLGSVPDTAGLADSYDVVVGADGIGSDVRSHLHPSSDPRRSSGFWTIRGTDPRTQDTYGEFWGDRQIFGITPIENGATNWFTAMRTDRRPTVDDLRAWYAGWPEPIGTLLKAASDEDVLCHEVQHVWPVPRSYVRGNQVLVGDAAHAMPPNLGQGGAQALLDVACLTEELDRRPVTDALAAYDRRRRPVTRRFVAGSLLMARVGLSGGVTARIRNVLMRALLP